MRAPSDRSNRSDAVDVSVVIACRNEERYFARQLAALCAQECSVAWEVVVSDNGSTDASVAIAESFRPLLPGLTIVDSSARPGPSAARNQGVRRATGRWIVFCDADDEVAPGWLAAMTAALEDHSLVAARLDHERLNEPWSSALRPAHAGLHQTDPPFLPFAHGAVMGVHRSLHERIGGYDESLMACEDRDYCYRAQLAGASFVAAPGALVYYRHRDSALGRYRQARGYGYGSVRLYRDYRRLGLGRPSPHRALLGWIAMPLLLPRAITSRRRFMVWMAQLGRRVGRLHGCLRFRVWAP